MLRGRLSVDEQEAAAAEIWRRLIRTYDPGFLEELFLATGMSPGCPGYTAFLVRVCERWGYRAEDFMRDMVPLGWQPEAK